MDAEGREECEVTLKVYNGETLELFRIAMDACFERAQKSTASEVGDSTSDYSRAAGEMRRIRQEIASQVPWETDVLGANEASAGQED